VGRHRTEQLARAITVAAERKNELNRVRRELCKKPTCSMWYRCRTEPLYPYVSSAALTLRSIDRVGLEAQFRSWRQDGDVWPKPNEMLFLIGIFKPTSYYLALRALYKGRLWFTVVTTNIQHTYRVFNNTFVPVGAYQGHGMPNLNDLALKSNAGNTTN
jgi:hypothetical protein